MLESELSAHESLPGATGTALVAELIALKSEMHQKEQELSELRLQLQSALHTSTEVCAARNHTQKPYPHRLVAYTTSLEVHSLHSKEHSCSSELSAFVL